MLMNKSQDIILNGKLPAQKTSFLASGREAKKLTLKLKSEFLKLKNKPTLAVIFIGNNSASKLYVGIKENLN